MCAFWPICPLLIMMPDVFRIILCLTLGCKACSVMCYFLLVRRMLWQDSLVYQQHVPPGHTASQRFYTSRCWGGGVEGMYVMLSHVSLVYTVLCAGLCIHCTFCLLEDVHSDSVGCGCLLLNWTSWRALLIKQQQILPVHTAS